MIAEAAKRLLASQEGAEVVQFLRGELQISAQAAGRPFSVNTLKTYVSHVKRRVLEAGFRNPDCDYATLIAAAGTDASDVAVFVSAPLKQQLEIQRRHRRQPCWSDEAEDALQSLPLLPTSMASFHITEREVRLIKRRDKSNLRERMADVTVVADGEALLARATELLRSAAKTDGYGTLLAPLLLVSGRREVEILNVCSGRSRFQKVGDRSVLFTGQAKTKSSEGAPAFVIPLLCEADAFLSALAVLQGLGESGIVRISKQRMPRWPFDPSFRPSVFGFLLYSTGGTVSSDAPSVRARKMRSASSKTLSRQSAYAGARVPGSPVLLSGFGVYPFLPVSGCMYSSVHQCAFCLTHC